MNGPAEGDDRQARMDLIRRIEQARGSRVICCFMSDRQNAPGLMAKDFLPKFFEHFGTEPIERIDVVLFTLGGDTLAAYALNRFLRELTKHLSVLIPHWCHSAGTLFSLGADELVMTKLATLSAIDPSIAGPLNPIMEAAPGVRQSVPVGVESVAGFRSVVSEDWRLADEGASRAFQMLTERVHPLLLGDLYRSREQIIKLATTLLGLHLQEPDKVSKIVNTLAKGLGSHDYLLSRTEVRELGLPVLADDAQLEGLIFELYRGYALEMELGQVFDPSIVQQSLLAGGPAVTISSNVVIIESTGRKDVWERTMVFPTPPAQPHITKNFWR